MKTQGQDGRRATIQEAKIINLHLKFFTMGFKCFCKTNQRTFTSWTFL